MVVCYTQSPENLPAWGAQEWTAAGAQTDRYRTNTKEEDPLGWINDGQRIRLPGLGRFLTPDPLGFADGPNPYVYVHQNPWTKFDPLGLTDEPPPKPSLYWRIFEGLGESIGEMFGLNPGHVDQEETSATDINAALGRVSERLT